MSKSQQTKDLLLFHARRLFWTRGYSNVSLREITSSAGADVALVSRYFGSKKGLFVATLDSLPALDLEEIRDVDALIEFVVGAFCVAERSADGPSGSALILMNASDPEVGALVRQKYQENWQQPLEQILKDSGKAALFSASMLGMSVAEKTLCLNGIADPDSADYERQLRTLLNAASGLLERGSLA